MGPPSFLRCLQLNFLFIKNNQAKEDSSSLYGGRSLWKVTKLDGWRNSTSLPLTICAINNEISSHFPQKWASESNSVRPCSSISLHIWSLFALCAALPSYKSCFGLSEILHWAFSLNSNAFVPMVHRPQKAIFHPTAALLLQTSSERAYNENTLRMLNRVLHEYSLVTECVLKCSWNKDNSKLTEEISHAKLRTYAKCNSPCNNLMKTPIIRYERRNSHCSTTFITENSG